MGTDPAGARAPREARIRRRVVLGGRVQMVGFRMFAARAAGELGVDGWVRNTPDGRVEAVVEGPPDAVDRVERRLVEGPAAAEVLAVEREDLAIDRPLTTFRVLA